MVSIPFPVADRERQSAAVSKAVHFRVFLSSPGDVAREREVARRLLEQLPRKPWLRGRLTLEVVAWDDPLASTPRSAVEGAQSAVERYNSPPSECDLTVAILWSR